MRQLWGWMTLGLVLGIQGTTSAQTERTVTLPEGFVLETFAAELGRVRFLAVHPSSGVLYASIIDGDKVVALPDANRDGQADRVVEVVGNIPSAHGLTWHDGWLYIAGTDRIVRVQDEDGDLKADGVPQLVAELPGGGGHFTRTIRFGPDGALYASIGSTCNVCEEKNPERAAIVRMSPTGADRRLYATGLRNAVGITFDADGRLWATNNGRDWLGNELPPECLYEVVDGGFYGWPYAYGNKVADPEWGKQCPECVERTRPPAWEFSAHTAPLGLGFYTGTQWPAEYQGDLFVAFHGSWNSTYKKGYKVMRVEFEGGRPMASHDFLSGFLHAKDDVWGRPVDVMTGADGSLYVTDDFGGKIFRISWVGTEGAE